MMDRLKRYLNFEELITTKVIKYVHGAFAAMLILGFLMSVVVAFVQMAYSPLAGLGMLLLAPIALAVGLVWLRLGCEIVIVLFKIRDGVEALEANTPTASRD